MTALTIGMATYDDFDGVYFTIEALRLYQDVSDTEFLVVDNFGCETTRQFVESIPGGRYVAATELIGTAAPRDLVFRRAAGRAVMCIDSHVMLVPGAVARLKEYYREHPETNDLLQGPLLYDNLDHVSTHFRPEWSAQMWGVWETDPRGLDPDGEPFDIPMQGLGLFSCRRRAWLGFNPLFRGFGGEEGYIHQKFRQHGARTLCLPWLRWVHRFSRPKGVPYPLTVEDKLRNYVIGHTELGLDIQPALDHFAEFLSVETVERVRDEALSAMAAKPADPKADRRKEKRRKRKAKEPTAAATEEPFDGDVVRALMDAIPDEVRIAMGLEPQHVQGFPPPGPERDAARAESRALLLEQGWLDEVDLGTLSVEEAIATARRTVLENVRIASPAPDGEFARLGITPFGDVSEKGRAAGSVHGPNSPPGADDVPLVSCICLTYNRAPDYLHLLEEAIESFLRQDWPNKELIVLNDTPNQKLVCDATGVRIVNSPRRYPSIGDKQNAAIALARGRLIAQWDDDDISLPWRLSLSVKRLETAGYFNPKRHWSMLGEEFEGAQSMGWGHNLSLYTRDAFERVGGFPSISGTEDAHMDSAFLATVETRGVPGSDGAELPQDEWYYIYRWGVSPRHMSGHGDPVEHYRNIGEMPIERGWFVLHPQWRQDYVAVVREWLAASVG